MISVIVPVYNVEDYLSGCIDSIIGQTCRGIEIILVDDGSTDSSGQICDEYAQKDARIRVIHKQNGGISSARNRGLDVARGEYISFIDSDDWVEPDFLEVLLRLLLDYDADVSQCFFVKESSKTKDKDLPVVRTDSCEIYEGRDIILHLLNKRTAFRTVLAWNKLYRRRLFESLRFPEGMVFEDEAFTHEILYKSDKLAVNDSTLYHYTWRANSVSHDKRPLKFLDLVRAVERRLAFFEEKKEEEFYLRMIPRYSNELMRAGSNVYFSQLDNRPHHLQEIKQKLDANMDAFRENKYMRKEYLLLLKLYGLNPGLGFHAHRKLTKAKDFYKELRTQARIKTP